MSKSKIPPLWYIWKMMRQRCNNPNCPAYHRYGGRGIRVCERWDNFKVFASDMGPRPTKLHSIDRIDNDRDYEPENCRWATRVEQNMNKTTTKLTLDDVREIRKKVAGGRKQVDVAKEYGIVPSYVCEIASGKRFQFLWEDQP